MAQTSTRPSFSLGSSESNQRGLARIGVGLLLIALWWPIAWLEIRPLSDYYFFPLWFGYILAVDGLLTVRTGTSPMSRSGLRVLWLFLSSSALWWIFEGFNEIVGNWRYHTPVTYTDLEYFLLASLAFSTVIPAVLTTTELVRSFRLDPLRFLPRLRRSTPRLFAYHVIGWLIIAATIVAPDIFFPLVWFTLFFLLDPIVTALGGRSIGRFVDRRDWSPLFNLGMGTLICGFFWEMWNVYALPKWTYDIPYADWLHVFEMPILGFGGYIPFGLEVYVFYELFRTVARRFSPPVTFVSSRDRPENAGGRTDG